MTESAAESQHSDFWEVESDTLLVALVSAARHTDGFLIGITLNLPGGVVTGDLVNPGRWWREIAEWDRVSDSTREFVETLRDAMTSDELEEDEPPEIIFLRNARVVSPGGATPVEGMFWRGRIDQVAGWSMGALDIAARG